MESHTSSASSSLHRGGASPCLNSGVTTTKKAKRKAKTPISKARHAKLTMKKNKKSNKKKAAKKNVVKKQVKKELSPADIALNKKLAASTYKSKKLKLLREELHMKISMKLFNCTHCEMAIFDRICSIVKDMIVGKTISFNNLLVFGADNSGNYLASKLLSVCVIIVILFMY